MVDKIKCCEVITSYTGGWPNSSRCTRNATTEHEGKPYCKQHNPAMRKEKADASYQAYKAEWSAKYDKQQTDANKIAVHDELVAALQRLIDVYSVSHSPETRQSCWEQARAALSKAKS